jgi:hypothetical protein
MNSNNLHPTPTTRNDLHDHQQGKARPIPHSPAIRLPKTHAGFIAECSSSKPYSHSFHRDLFELLFSSAELSSKDAHCCSGFGGVVRGSWELCGGRMDEW